MAVFTNKAVLSYSNGVIESNVVTGEVVQSLNATKNSVISEYSGSGVLTYVISIVNSGSVGYTNITVTDDLGAYVFAGTTFTPLTHVADSTVYYINGVLQAPPTVISAPRLIISGISVPAGGNALIIYQAEINEYAPLDIGASIVNTAVITGECFTSDITATETVTAVESPYLSIEKSLEPTSVTEGGTLNYTFVIENTGNTDATVADNIVVTDTFNPILSSLSVTFNGAPLALNTGYTYNAATGEFATVAGAITVPAAEFVQNPVTGVWEVFPGISVLTVSGTV